MDNVSSLPSIRSYESELRKIHLQSTYETEFNSQRFQLHTNIFNYKKLSEIPSSEILTQVTIMFIENWIELKDDTVYQSLILQCLRSLNAILRTNDTGKTEFQTQFRWNDPSKNYKSHRLDQVTTAFLGVRTTNNKVWTRPQTVEQVDTHIIPVTFTKEDLLKRKQALIQGSNLVGKWVVAPVNPNVSNYQETFTTHFNKYSQRSPPDKYTSISAGKQLPDPEIIRRHNSVNTFR